MAACSDSDRCLSGCDALYYVSFIALLFSLYVVAGGIVVSGNFHETPVGNTGMFLLGPCGRALLVAQGAAMIMVRPQ